MKNVLVVQCLIIFLHCHLRVFSEGRSPYDALKRDYCLKCMTDLQRKQGWLVPAIKHLYELLRHDSNKYI